VTELDNQALSVRQPWAYFLTALPSEHRCRVLNREWGPSEFRGPFWIRAGKKPTKKEFYAALEFAEGAFVPGELMPALNALPFQGIVGRARIVDVFPPGRPCDRWHDPTQYGYVIADAQPVAFVPCPGAQGFYTVPTAVLEQVGRAA
jgi:hypothetical protein